MEDRQIVIRGEKARASLELTLQFSSMSCPTRKVMERQFGRRGAKLKSFFAEVGRDGGREIAAKYVIEDAGQGDGGWEISGAAE